MKAYLCAGAGALIILAMLLAATIRLESAPPLWWDEGWTLTVARTWVERGHYGRLLDGQLAPPGLEAAFSVTAPVALSFRLLGVGLWQGRLVAVIFMLGALALMYYLALQLYDRSVAIGTLGLLLLLSMHPQLHSAIVGRQVLAELPMLFYLLAGYACLLAALQRSAWWILAAIGFWGIALITKAQVLPFWMASLSLPLLIELAKQRWTSAALLAIGFLGSLTASRSLLWLQHLLLYGQTLPTTPLHGMYDVTAYVPVVGNRLFALKLVLLFGLPTLLGIGYAVRSSFTHPASPVQKVHVEIVRRALLALASGWLAWYLLLSVGWPRYLFPPIFIGSLFTASLLRELADYLSPPSTMERGTHAFRRLCFNRQSVVALLAMGLVALTFSTTLRMFYRSFVTGSDASALQVAEFLNTHTAADALIETYDSELFFLMDRRYHYPPDQIHVELNRRTFLGQDISIDYNPLAADPDYLVVGPQSKLWRLYDPVLGTGAFHLLRTYHRYDVYERVR